MVLGRKDNSNRNPGALFRSILAEGLFSNRRRADIFHRLEEDFSRLPAELSIRLHPEEVFSPRQEGLFFRHLLEEHFNPRL